MILTSIFAKLYWTNTYMKKLIAFLSLTVLLQSCLNTGNISDRKYPLTEPIDESIDTFKIYKYVPIELVFPAKIDFNGTRTIIMVGGKCVYNDFQKKLSTQKIGIPKPDENGKYLLSVHLVDFKNKFIYLWASDNAAGLDSQKRNVITLLYTGTKEDPITLEVKNRPL